MQRIGPRVALTWAVAVVGAGVVAVAGHRRRTRFRPQWKSVTVLATPSDLRSGALTVLPPHDVRLVAAPGDRGTEVHVRYRNSHGVAAGLALRAALRDLKQRTETGGVLHVDPRPHGRRRPTPQGLLQDQAEKYAKGWGLL